MRVRNQRAIEVIASGLQCRVGKQQAVDVTVCIVLTHQGDARPQGDWRDVAACETARSDKERTYPELFVGDQAQLVVLAIEVGGRFSAETGQFLRDLATSKASTVPSYLRRSRS